MQIAASLGQSIAFWSLSGVQKDVWRVHYSLVIADNNSFSAIDCKSGKSHHSLLLLYIINTNKVSSGLEAQTEFPYLHST